MKRLKCVECAKVLRANHRTLYEKKEVTETVPYRAAGSSTIERREVTNTYTVPVGKELVGYGYASEGLFCTLRCGYDFAVRLVRGGVTR